MSKSSTIHIGRNFKKVRELFGITQMALAEATNFTQQYISKLERSRYIPDSVLQRLAGPMNITPDLIRNFDLKKVIQNIPFDYLPVVGALGQLDKQINKLQFALDSLKENIAPVAQSVDILSKTYQDWRGQPNESP